MPVRVIALCGSLQQRSSNRSALDVVLDRLRHQHRADVDDVELLGSLPPFNPEQDDEPGEVVGAWRRRAGAAEALVVAGPEYAGSLAGSLKNALDWLVGAGALDGKVAGVICAGTTGGRYAREELIRTLTWHGARVVAQVGIAAPRTKSDAAGTIVDPATLDQLDRLAATVVEAVGLPTRGRWELAVAAGREVGLEIDRIGPAADPGRSR